MCNIDTKAMLEKFKANPLVIQTVRTIKTKYPNVKVYASDWGDTKVCVYPTELSAAQCDDIGSMVLSDYSYLNAGDDFEYPLFIDCYRGISKEAMVDVTDLGGV